MEGSSQSLSRRFCPVFLFLTLVVVASLLGLAALRVYAFRLELRLHKVSLQIKNIESQESLLQQTLSSLVAPGRIVQYSRETLGMDSLSQIRIVQIPAFVDKYTVRANSIQNNIKNKNILQGFFATKANAHN